jgi:glycerol uptake facilitator-like aquaporin
MWLAGRPPARDLAGYALAQVIGAVLAGLLLLLATSEDEVATTATVPASNGPPS